MRVKRLLLENKELRVCGGDAELCCFPQWVTVGGPEVDPETRSCVQD